MSADLEVNVDGEPDEPAEPAKVRRRWMPDIWKRFRRVIKDFAGEGIVMILVCRGCGKNLKPAEVPGGYDLACACTVREIRK